MFKRKCKITYICHGATVHSEDSRLCHDEKYPPLEEKGQEEIKNVCEYLKQRGVKSDKIYSSPAARCIQSANMVAKVFRQDFDIVQELNSRNWGQWNGCTLDKIVKKYGFTYDDISPSVLALTPDDGEGMVDYNKRINKVILDLVNKNIDSRLIVITGPNVIQSVVAATLGVSPEKQARILIKPGSITQISYFEDWSSLIYSGVVPL